MPRAKQALSRSFEQPDERRDFLGHGHLDILNFDKELSVGRGVFEPGWIWSKDVKPIAGTESCQTEHLGYCLSGTMVIKMDSGEEHRVRAGEAFHFSPGHDAWVEGDQPCEILDFVGARVYAIQRKSKAA